MDRELYESTATEGSALVNPDRLLTARGTTPLLELAPDAARLAWTTVANTFEGNVNEFSELLKRGATPAMVQKFSLRFSPTLGIVAWASPELYEAFAGPRMQDTDFWKIHLGRRVELRKDDMDGSEFIEGLLEEVLLYQPYPQSQPSTRRMFGGWVTVEETLGIWLTEPRYKDKEVRALQNPGLYNEHPAVGHDNSEISSFHQDEDQQLNNGVDERLHLLHTGPVIQIDFYEQTDEEDEDEDEGQEGEGSDASQSRHEHTEDDDEDVITGWTAHGLDSAYDSCASGTSSDDEGMDEDTEWNPSEGLSLGKRGNEEGGSDAGVNPKRMKLRETVEDEDDIEDSADSDFNSDESLSRDEWVMSGQKQDILAQPSAQTTAPSTSAAKLPVTAGQVAPTSTQPNLNQTPFTAAVPSILQPAPRENGVPGPGAASSSNSNLLKALRIEAGASAPHASTSLVASSSKVNNAPSPMNVYIAQTTQSAPKTSTPKGPKKATNSYNYFAQEHWRSIAQANPGVEPSQFFAGSSPSGIATDPTCQKISHRSSAPLGLSLVLRRNG